MNPKDIFDNYQSNIFNKYAAKLLVLQLTEKAVEEEFNEMLESQQIVKTDKMDWSEKFEKPKIKEQDLTETDKLFIDYMDSLTSFSEKC
jgi:hypothetical protein